VNASPPRSLVNLVEGLIADDVPVLSCDESFERIDAYVEHLAADPSYEDPAVRRHLETCPDCAEDAAGVLELVAADRAPAGDLGDAARR
jgi:anti-sigma factor RsiW